MDPVSGIAAAQSSLSLVSTLRAAFGGDQALSAPLLRAVWLEVRRNHEVLRAAKLAAAKSKKKHPVAEDDPSYASLVRQLQTDALGAFVLVVGEQGWARKVWGGKTQLTQVTITSAHEGKGKTATLPRACEYLVVRITALQALAAVDPPARGRVKFRTRLRNLRENLAEVERALAQLDQLKVLRARGAPSLSGRSSTPGRLAPPVDSR